MAAPPVTTYVSSLVGSESTGETGWGGARITTTARIIAEPAVGGDPTNTTGQPDDWLDFATHSMSHVALIDKSLLILFA